MNTNGLNLLARNERCNLRVDAFQRSFATHTAQVHAQLRSGPFLSTYEDKVTNAFMRNAVFGFQQGASWSTAIAFLGAPVGFLPRLPVGMRALQLPIDMLRPFGPAGVVVAGALLVGKYGSSIVPDFVSAGPFAYRGALGLAVQGLHQVANNALTNGWTRSGQACLWGAGLIAVTCTVARVLLFAVNTSLSIGFGVIAGTLGGLSAGVYQLTRSSHADVVDFASMLGA